MNNRILYLGEHKDLGKLWLEDFKWNCGWYWGGGYIGNKDLHMHFKYFLNLGCNDTTFGYELLSETKITESQWWRLLDLFKQFYAYKEAAECFQYGGYMTTDGRKDAEISKPMASMINKHIETVIISEIRELCKIIEEGR